MKKSIICIFTICSILLVGCSSKQDSNSYEDVLKKIVATAPEEYAESFNKGSVEGFEEAITYIKEEFSDSIEEGCLETMINEQNINTFYTYSIVNDVEIECESVEIKETSDNHYSFEVVYTINDEEGNYAGNFQTDEDGKINHYRVNTLNLSK